MTHYADSSFLLSRYVLDANKKSDCLLVRAERATGLDAIAHAGGEYGVRVGCLSRLAHDN